jgi:hypothetical protein
LGGRYYFGDAREIAGRETFNDLAAIAICPILIGLQRCNGRWAAHAAK